MSGCRDIRINEEDTRRGRRLFIRPGMGINQANARQRDALTRPLVNGEYIGDHNVVYCCAEYDMKTVASSDTSVA